MVFLKTIALAYKERRSEKINFELNLEKQVECRYTEIVFVCLGVWLEQPEGRMKKKQHEKCEYFSSVRYGFSITNAMGRKMASKTTPAWLTSKWETAPR